MIVGGFAMTATENIYKTSLINNRRYLGNKYKLLSFIYNDLNENLLYLYNTFKNLDKESVLEWIYEIIEKYNLSLVNMYQLLL